MSETYPRPETENAEPRNPTGWIVLGLLLLLALYQLFRGFSGEKSGGDRTKLLTELRAGVVSREIGKRFPLGEETDRALVKLEEKVSATRKTDPATAAIWAAVRTELGKPITREDLAPALRSPDEDIRTVGKAYLKRPVTAKEAEPLLTKLDERGSLSRLAAAHLREAANLPGARREIQSWVSRYLTLLGLVLAVGFGCLLAWGGLLLSGSPDKRFPFAPAIEARSPAEADHFAIRAATLYATFLVLSLVFGLSGLPVSIRTLFMGALMIAAVPFVLRRRPSFEEVVRYREGLGGKVALGLWGFFLEIPVTLLVAGIGQWLFQNLPTNEHPAATMLMNTHDPLLIVSLFFAGAILAPFWEEIMFRGLLFPALSKLVRSGVAALLSSLAFASVHPQGPGGWLGLMAFAMCSCVLASRTRSLVPSIVMHAAHNATLLTMALLMGS